MSNEQEPKYNSSQIDMDYRNSLDKEEIKSLESKLAIAVEALEKIEGGDDNGDCEVAEQALAKVKPETMKESQGGENPYFRDC